MCMANLLPEYVYNNYFEVQQTRSIYVEVTERMKGWKTAVGFVAYREKYCTLNLIIWYIYYIPNYIYMATQYFKLLMTSGDFSITRWLSQDIVTVAYS